MAIEGTYEYECMRAELLGIEKPDYEEFTKNKAEKEAIEREALEAESLREVHEQTEGFQQIGGKLEELNNILKSTQKKINSFTAPFSRFLKSKMGMSSRNTDNPVNDATLQPDRGEIESDPEDYKEPAKKKLPTVEYPLTTKDQAENQDLNPDYMPVIDDIIEKYEKSQIEMEFQNKQMKRLLQ